MIGKKRSLVCGWGINDADYVVQPTVNGKQVWCKYYQLWFNMIRRGYSDKLKEKYPTYKDVTVCDEWKYFTSFREWCTCYETKHNVDVKKLQLDKDILVSGNKDYNPSSCCFVDHMTNTFLINCTGSRGDYLVGVYRNKESSKFNSECSNPFTGKGEYLGRFTDELQAHRAWQSRKHELALQLAELQHDSRVANALRERYAPDKDLTNI